MTYVFALPPQPTVPVAGGSDLFPVRRIFCVGRNYADHAREMGATDQADGREPPFFFMKPADALVSGTGSYPSPTRPRRGICTTRSNWWRPWLQEGPTFRSPVRWIASSAMPWAST